MDREYLEFLKDAYSNGLCSEYRDEIRKCHDDKLELMRLAMRQQSIPYMATKLASGVASKDYLLKTFGEYLNGYLLKDCDGVPNYTYSWFVDYDYDNDLVVDVDVAHISFTIGATVVVPQTKCPIIYISNRSNVHLVCEGYNAVKIYLFDKAKVTLEDVDEESSVTVYKYSDMCEVERGKYCLSDKIKTFNKELRL